MKKLLLILGLSSLVFAKINGIVSVLPEKTFLEKIGGDRVDVSLMVLPGNSPHTYEPKPSQMKDISKADLYFSIGVEFEEVWLPKFMNQNKKMIVIDLTKGIKQIEMVKHHHKEEGFFDKVVEFFSSHNEEEHHHEHHDEKDPHIWTSPSNVKIIAQNIYDGLVKIDDINKDYYKKNLDDFFNEIDKTDKEIKDIFKDLKKGTKFMVFHPSWGYFAKEYDIIQLPIEVEGKNPKPKAVARIIEEAKETNVNGIFTQPEFSDKSAKIIAEEVGVKVVKISPLSPNWSENLINLAKGIANK